MTRHDEAAIAIGVFVFLFTLIPGLINRKNNWTIEHSRGLMRTRVVPKLPTSAFREVVTAIAAGVIFGLLVWWGLD